MQHNLRTLHFSHTALSDLTDSGLAALAGKVSLALSINETPLPGCDVDQDERSEVDM